MIKFHFLFISFIEEYNKYALLDLVKKDLLYENKIFSTYDIFISLKHSHPVEVSVHHYEFNEKADTYIFGDNVRVRETLDLLINRLQ